MDLGYIERKLNELRALKTQIMKEMKMDWADEEDFKNGMSFVTKKYKRRFENLKDMKIACIMDEFSFNSYNPECQLMQVTPNNWRSEIREFKPDLFFLESAWKGRDGLWNTQVAHLSDELVDLLTYVRKNDIPIIFWNKEDPVHYTTFLATAKYADFVFTTDIDCIKNYKTILKHERVYLLPFAAQTKFHNPLEYYERQDKYCFAGAYYKRYPERRHDLETFVEAITETKELEIYDRNYYNDDPNYTFPKSYKRYIVGNLKADEIDKAYKGYRYNINMNSVKQSQSMCARRVYELLASNTVTLSNYSKAVRNLFGDLVICTDDGKRLKDEIKKFEDAEYYQKFRLQGLRKVMQEHTYQDRLNYIVNKVFMNPLELVQPTVGVFVSANTDEEITRAVKQFEKQQYESKHLFVVANHSGDSFISLDPGISIISKNLSERLSGIKEEYDYITFFSNKDYYGENYITDLILALKYSDSIVITKGTYYSYEESVIQKKNEGNQYRPVSQARVRRSLIQSDFLSMDELVAIVESIDDAVVETTALSIDEYNYCMNKVEDESPIVDDLYILDKGLRFSAINDIVRNIKRAESISQNTILSPNDILELVGPPKKLFLQLDNNALEVQSKLATGHQYVYMNKYFPIEEIKFDSMMDMYLDVDFQSRFSLDLVAIFYDHKKNKINSVIKPCNRKITLSIDTSIKYVKFGFRIAEAGKCYIKQLIIGQINVDTGCYLNKSNVLLIADNYPDYQDLYRYAFIHSRLIEYKKQGQLVDVFKLNEKYNKGYSEFGGIDVVTGYFEELRNNLFYASYDTILIHFLNGDIWECIKNSVGDKKIVVWIHGSEIQPWWRRKYNYSSDQQLNKAKAESEKRLAFWKEIFKLALSGQYSFHFVFVSNYFAHEVFEDINIVLPKEKYSVIHNYIDNRLFSYSKKDPELRKKILSIRPFANRKYANDLTVKAIQMLAKESFFKELEFKIIGQGELFHSTLKPLRKYKNVSIEEKFLRQEEIAEVHKQYGVFIVPTRMDSQGVSRDEAMSSGLVPITNRVAAIPEFIDEQCGMLAEEEDYAGLAESIKLLYMEPELFLKLSMNAANRVKNQSGYQYTILKEINLINV